MLGNPGEYLPVDLGEDMVHGKGGAVVVIQEPDGLVEVDLLVMHARRVVYADNDRRQPGQQHEDFVCEDRAMAVCLPPREGVPCRKKMMVSNPYHEAKTMIGIGDILQASHPAMVAVSEFFF